VLRRFNAEANNLDSISSINKITQDVLHAQTTTSFASYSKSRSRNESRLRNKTVKEALFSDFEGDKNLRMGERFHYDSS
jgi:hypothetical protein